MVGLSFVTAFQWKPSKIMFLLKYKCNRVHFLKDSLYGHFREKLSQSSSPLSYL